MIVLTLMFLKVSKEIMVKKKKFDPYRGRPSTKFYFSHWICVSAYAILLTRKCVSTKFALMSGPGCIYSLYM